MARDERNEMEIQLNLDRPTYDWRPGGYDADGSPRYEIIGGGGLVVVAYAPTADEARAECARRNA